MSMPIIVIIVLFVVIILANALKILQEYERGVVFRLGRFAGVKGPGLIIIIPFIDKIAVKVNAVVYFKVLEPEKAVIAVQDYLYATSQISQTTLRSVLGEAELDEVLSSRDKINKDLQQIIDEQTDPWGIKVSLVEIKHVDLPESMQRAMAKQAESERERRAKVIHAMGEAEASEKLREASDTLAKSPSALQLRFLQTLSDVAAEKNSTIIFPLPIELIKPLLGKDWAK